ncbi:MAG: bifunctional diaminohydroxyphosphoribosylaminopyrimidine deaminase/5-amino-6-(5-phosphoribosylamino)uracil reductase RibD [Cyanobacteria bacterium SIG32]|nr:bifunctional diaminohydroxyphosphoribosylaminopyrimidine deaminase/5-amino-6-(5-phosphoribosylamino)uracil reductase RibD [Cyanobacteria bacterium SIG32]
MQKSLDEKYMHMCLELAEQGRGKVSPNPMVGCVILDINGNIVSKGYHKKYGENHAERDALLKLRNNEAEKGTLYVNLEPCSHYGKTPPCVDLIIERKIKRVVIASRDPNPKVNGLSKLKESGIEVTEGVLEEEARFLNRIFFKNITQKLPYVVLKTATTMDGKIATKTGDSKWITSEESRKEVYRMREEFDCILTSSNTVIADNPTMKVNEGQIKCILDKDNRTSKDAKIYQQGQIYIANKDNTSLKNNQLDLRNVLEELYHRGVCSVFVECGGRLAGAFLRENLVDEIYQFIAPKIVNDNSAKSCFDGDSLEKIADCKRFRIYDTQLFGEDIMIKTILKNTP